MYTNSLTNTYCCFHAIRQFNMLGHSGRKYWRDGATMDETTFQACTIQCISPLFIGRISNVLLILLDKVCNDTIQHHLLMALNSQQFIHSVRKRPTGRLQCYTFKKHNKNALTHRKNAKFKNKIH